MEARYISFKRGDESSISLQVSEYPSKRIYTWEAALLLAAYLFHHSDSIVKDKRVIEIGCGTGLCGLMAAQLGAKEVIMTDRNQPLSIEIVHSSIINNNLQRNCVVRPLEWPFFYAVNTQQTPLSPSSINHVYSDDGDGESIAASMICDVILAADVFYSQDTIEHAMITIVSLLSKSTHAVCITTYQERSSNRTLLPYLEKYGLEVTEIQTEQILHGCNLVGQVWKDTAGDDDEDGKDGEDVPCFHSIHLLEIRLDQ